MDKRIVFLGIGFELVAMTVGGFYLGVFIDEYMGWKATASTYLVLVLMMSWFFHLFILLRRFEKEAEKEVQDDADNWN
jgi:F0F1-type ATP synthase assembly protein I